MPLTGSEAHSIIAGGLLHGDQVTGMAQMDGSAADVGTWWVVRIARWEMRVISGVCRVKVVGGGVGAPIMPREDGGVEVREGV